MSLAQFFLDDQRLEECDDGNTVITLSDEDRNHLRALRLKPGEHIALIDASEVYFECEILSFTNDGLEIRIAQRQDVSTLRPHIMLIQGVSKGEKMDIVFRQATELGVEEFVPLCTDRSIVKLDSRKIEMRMKRWETIVKNAAMQSAQPRIPKVHRPVSIKELPELLENISALIICWEDECKSSLADFLETCLDDRGSKAHDTGIAIVVGPEGGLSQDEVKSLLDMHSCSSTVSLGPSILRTETAGIVAPALVLYELGVLR